MNTPSEQCDIVIYQSINPHSTPLRSENSLTYRNRLANTLKYLPDFYCAGTGGFLANTVGGFITCHNFLTLFEIKHLIVFIKKVMKCCLSNLGLSTRSNKTLKVIFEKHPAARSYFHLSREENRRVVTSLPSGTDFPPLENFWLRPEEESGPSEFSQSIFAPPPLPSPQTSFPAPPAPTS